MTAIALNRLKPIKGSIKDVSVTAHTEDDLGLEIDNQTILVIYSTSNAGARNTTLHGVEAMDGGGTESLVVSCGTASNADIAVVAGLKARNWALGGNLAITPASGATSNLSYAGVRLFKPISTGTRPIVVENLIVADGDQNLAKDDVLAIPNDGSTLIFTGAISGTPDLVVKGSGVSNDSGRPGIMAIGNPGARGVFGPFPTNVFGSTIYIENNSGSASTVAMAALSLTNTARVTKPDSSS